MKRTPLLVTLTLYFACLLFAAGALVYYEQARLNRSALLDALRSQAGRRSAELAALLRNLTISLTSVNE